MSKKVRVRFAPSPTGPLHMGGVRTALYNYLFAKKHNGDFILRVEDTDQTRFVKGAEEYILKSLEWTGISPNEGQSIGGDFGPYKQSERTSIYTQYIDQLIQNDKAYIAFDTPEDLNQVREQAKQSGYAGWQYNYITRMSMKNSLTLSEDEVKERLNNNDPYVVRVKLPMKEEVKFNDLIRGVVSVNTAHMDDKVLWKADGLPTYHLANVVDDHLMNISHVIRGEEWLPSAPLHVFLYQAFGWDTPDFAHLPLILRPDGKGKLSKRDGDRLGFPVFPLNWTNPETGEVSMGYKERGYLPESFINMLSLLGWNPGDNRELFTLEELEKDFDLTKVNKSGARFDPKKAEWFNNKYINHLSQDALRSVAVDFLPETLQKSNDKNNTILGLMKERVNFLTEFDDLCAFFFKTLEYDMETIQKKIKENTPVQLAYFIEQIESSNATTADEFKAVFEDTLAHFELKFGQFGPVARYGTTYSMSGPSLFDIYSILGKDQVVSRLKSFHAFIS